MDDARCARPMPRALDQAATRAPTALNTKVKAPISVLTQPWRERSFEAVTMDDDNAQDSGLS
jgi:hypothetical protein